MTSRKLRGTDPITELEPDAPSPPGRSSNTALGIAALPRRAARGLASSSVRALARAARALHLVLLGCDLTQPQSLPDVRRPALESVVRRLALDLLRFPAV